MARSQNGWSTVTSARVSSYAVPGCGTRLPMRDGDVATVLGYVAHQFHLYVEALHTGWCWGYAPRNVRGSSSIISNHASATAIDLNAPNHPLGVRGTFSKQKVKAIEKILAFCEGAVRWGGHYSGRKDEMHFEINAGSATVARIARKIRALKAKAAALKPVTSISVVLREGSGARSQVLLLQKTMDKRPDVTLKPDGDFGPKTTTAVKTVQRKAKIKADGVVGPATCKILGIKWTGK
jgi:hypothetical protein